MNIKETLKKEACEKYKKFSSALIPNVANMLGVRLPVLRKIAKEIIHSKKELSFLNETPEYFEETMLQGMVTGLIECDFEDKIKLIEDFIPKINNWSVCDSFCASLGFIKKEKEAFWNFIKPYSKSKKEFEIRFFLIVSLMYYVEKKYLNEIFSALNKIKLDDYYAQMGAAWLISVCYIKFPDETKKFLSNNKLNKETQNKAIRKITESFRVSKKDKEEAKAYKKTAR